MSERTAPTTPTAPPADHGGEALLLELGRALHSYGTPAHRLEAALAGLARRLGVEAEFFSAPTAIFAQFGGPGGVARLARVEPGEVNLEKQALLDEVAERVWHGTLDPAAALAAVRRIVAALPRYGPALSTACFGLASGAAARFFGGGLREIAASVVVGLAIGLLAVAAGRRPALGRVFETLAATLATALAVSANWLAFPVSVYVTTLAGLIVLIPGLTLTVAINELATRNWVSGTARLVGAGAAFVQIGLGVTLGSQLTRVLPGWQPPPVPDQLPAWTVAVAVVGASLGFVVLFGARPGDAPWIVAAGAIAFWGARGGAELLGPQLGVAAGAFAVGAASNLYSRWANVPTAITLVPGIMLLVPGGLGFSSLSAMLDKNVVSGVETAFAALMVAVALVAGLLVANVLVPARKAL